MLKEFDDLDKEEYIQTHLGLAALKNIENIHRGGENAAKGQKYEDLFSLFKVLEVSCASNNWTKHRFSRQRLDFFDDVCYEDFELNIKHNYQAKNSSTLHSSTATWNKEHEERARKQIKIDLGFHKATLSQNYLVVSSEKIHLQNINKIPNDLKSTCHSLYFPYYANKFAEFVTEQLSDKLESLTGSQNASDWLYQATLLLGVLVSTDEPRTLENIFDSAGSDAHPNPFIKTDKRLPAWLVKTIDKNNLSYQIKGASLTISYRSLELSIPMSEVINLAEPAQEKTADLSSLIQYFMQISARSLGQE